MWWLKLEWWKAETHALCLECGGDLSCHCWSALLPFKACFTVQEKRKSIHSFTGITFTDVLAYWQRHRTGLRVGCSWSQVRTLPLPQDASACWWRPRGVTVTLGAVPKQLWLLKLRRTLALNVYAPGHKYPTTQSLQFLLEMATVLNCPSLLVLPARRGWAAQQRGIVPIATWRYMGKVCCLLLVRADYIGPRPRARPRGHGELLNWLRNCIAWVAATVHSKTESS